MSDRTCTLPGCDKPVHGRGICTMHALRMRKHGSYDDPRPTVQQRFASKYRRETEPPVRRPDLDPCWTWTGASGSNGYGIFTIGGRNVMAHRASYELHVAPIPEGDEVDHLCLVVDCVNPTHLEAVAPIVNKRRSDASYTKGTALTECHRGHAFDDENTYIAPNGTRKCRSCMRLKRQQRREAQHEPFRSVASGSVGHRVREI